MDTSMPVDCDTRDIFQCIRRASLIRHVSYTKMRLKHSDVAKELPEIRAEFQHFQKKLLKGYKEGMSAHNSLLIRGMGQGLGRLIPAHKLMCPTLDSYLLRLHSDKISDVLESLTAFAERVSLILLDNSDARRVIFTHHLLIHRRHWRALGRRVLHLVRQICLREEELRKDAPELWPSWRRLQSAASQAALIYARMMPADALVLLAAPARLDTLDSPTTLGTVQSRSAAFIAHRRGVARPN